MRIVVSFDPPHRPGTGPSDAAAGRQFAEAAARLARDHDLVIHHERMARTVGSATRDVGPDGAAPAATTRSHELMVLEQELRNALPTTKPVAVVLAMIEVAATQTTAQAVARKIRGLGPRRHPRPAAPTPGELVPEPARMLPHAILDTRPVEWLLAHDCLVVCGCPATVSHEPATRRLAVADGTVDATDVSVVLAEDLAADLLVVVSDEPITPDRGIPRQRRAGLDPDHLDPDSLPEPLSSRVRAAARFATTPDRSSVVTTPQELRDIIKAGAGLWIRPP